jgi:hypothetical protein
MTTLAGHVTETTTRAPVADLVVRAILLPPSEDGARRPTPISVGSAATDEGGHFAIRAVLPEGEPIARIALAVTAPDSPENRPAGTEGRDPTPFPSGDELLVTAPREVTLGVVEQYRLRIDAGRLEAAGVLPPDASAGGTRLSERARRVVQEADEAERALGDAVGGRVNADRVLADTFSTDFLPTFLSDAVAADGAVQNERYSFVVGPADGEAPGTLARASIKAGIARIHAETQVQSGASASRKGRRRTRFFFSDSQLEALDNATSGGGSLPTGQFSEIGESALFAILGTDAHLDESGPPVEVTREEELFDAFLNETIEEACVRELFEPSLPDSGGSEGDDDSDDTGGGSTNSSPADADDILSLLSRSIEDVTSPLRALTGDGAGPGLAASIRDFAIPVGPADEPRVFDFSTLEVAFDDVWQTVVDQRLEPLARALHVKSSRVLKDRVVGAEKLADFGQLTASLRSVRTAMQNAAPAMAGRLGLAGRFGGSMLDMDEIDPGRPPFEPPPPDPPGGPFIPERPELPTDMVTAPPQHDGGNANPDATPEELIDQINEILRSPHSFTAFGADKRSKAINFGLLVGYRHVMTPVTYQVGDLVKSVTLAPNESREYTTRTVTTRKRAEKEVIKHSSMRRDELSETNRAESEIIRKALAKTNFSLNSSGTYNLGFTKGEAKTGASRDGETNSNEVKKSFREAVLKASEELRQERSIDVSFEETFEFEETAKGRIENPNNELTLTCLFFELQRRFRVNETIHKATPVVLIAQDVPSPDQITNAFLVRHAWVIRRALLDDGFEPALDYVQGQIIGDRLEVIALGDTLNVHRRQARELRTQLQALEEQAGRRYEALVQAVKDRIEEESQEESDGFFADLGESLFGGGQTTGAARLREEAARDAEQRAAQQAKEMAVQLQRAVNALNEATEAYNRANRRYHTMDLEVARLRLHIKEHLLHYMQAIWAHEVEDQRFLRLYQQPVPQFVRQGNTEPIYRRLGDAAGVTTVRVAPEGTGGALIAETRTAVDFELVPSIEVLPETSDRPLVEVADLSRLLGFLGNYMIFPMQESNALTDLMLNPYVDEGLRLLDPHDPGNITRPQFAEYVCQLRERLTDEEFEAIREPLEKRYRDLLLSSEYAGDEIVVPSGALYIEALPGATPLLESFKLAHRAFDLATAQEDARKVVLENLRRAARIVEGELDDPDADARYDFYGAPGVVAPTPSGGGDPGGGGGSDNGGG